jgi:hypothetical protein
MLTWVDWFCGAPGLGLKGCWGGLSKWTKMNRLMTYLAFAIAALDLVCFSLFLALPALEIEPSIKQKIGSLVVNGGVILSAISAVVVCLLLTFVSGSKGLSRLQKFSAVLMAAFAIFVFLYIVNVFRQGI